MFWPFRRKKIASGSTPEVPPAVERVTPPNCWPEAADPPEEWADPGEAAKYHWLMSGRIDGNRAERESRRADRARYLAEYQRDRAGRPGPEPSGGFDDSAHVFPRIGATRRDLVALGQALLAWRDRHGAGSVAIEGLDRLLDGHYPMMELYMGCINDYTSHAPGWEICPAHVAARSPAMPGADLIGCLQDELPEELWSHIGGIMPD